MSGQQERVPTTGGADGRSARSGRSRGARWWGPVTATLVVVGLGTGGAAIAVAVSGADPASAGTGGTRPTASVPARPEPTARASTSPAPGASATAAAVVPVSRLAEAGWVTRVAGEAGVPERALAAYAGAALQVNGELPACHLGWNTLAAIGQVESDHGSAGGAVLGVDGTVTPAIVGPALDGTGGRATVTDSDTGALDGDTTHDRAVGPMQFLPSSWARWAADGDGDGVSDPQNIDDAALAAGRYLCESGDLADPDTWIAAVAAYNDTVEYNNQVAAAADAFAAFG